MILPMITAHSGCELTEIDTLASIDAALLLEADAVEVDVRVDTKGELWVSHDVLLQNEYLTKLTLREVFDKLRDTRLLVNCDIKEQGALYKVFEEAEKYAFPGDRLILSGCTGPEQLARDRSITERGRICLNIEEVLKFVYLYRKQEISMDRFILLMNDPWLILKENGMQIEDAWIEDTIRCYQMLKAAAANIPKFLLDTKLAVGLKDAGIPLSVWTVNEPEIVRSCLSAGVQNITTRMVRQAIEIRREFSAKAAWTDENVKKTRLMLNSCDFYPIVDLYNGC